MKKKLLWLVCMCCLVGYVFFGIPSFSLSQSKLKIQVLPLNCQFEVIDVGTNEIRYLTPEECGESPSPQQPIAEPADPTDAGLAQNDNRPSGTIDQGDGDSTVDFNGDHNNDATARHTQEDKAGVRPHTIQDVAILTLLAIFSVIVTDVLLLNGWVGQRLARLKPLFARRRG